MKTLRLLVSMTACVMLFAECKKENTVHNGVLSINNSSESQEVAFEDVATDISIVPLICDEPMDGINSIKCYGSRAVMRANGAESIYIFDDGKLTAKLNKVGRGRGEYTIISSFVYSPSTNILYVQGAGSMILKYSVPEMEHLGTLQLKNVTGFAEHDDSTLICRMTLDDEIPGIYFVNADDGQVRGKLKDVCGLSFLMSPDMAYYSPAHRILAELSSRSVILEVSADINGGEETILRFDFGKDGMPAKYDSIGSDTDLDFIMELGQYLNDHRETVVTEVNKVMVKDGSVSFWYQAGLVGYKHYFRLEGDDIVKYTGFKASGTKGFILPTGLTDDGRYVSVVDLLPETMFDETGNRSPFTTELENVMKSQAFNNPVLVFYNIK